MVLTAVYNAWDTFHVNRSLVVLMNKKSSREELNNWRPIVMGGEIFKLFTAEISKGILAA